VRDPVYALAVGWKVRWLGALCSVYTAVARGNANRHTTRLAAAGFVEPSLPQLRLLHSFEQLTHTVLSVRGERRPHSIENRLLERLRS
jgi:hypothetical protein